MKDMIRKDLYRIDVEDGLYILVFHKKYNEGIGPALSVYIHNFEYLKFDCFGKSKGHFHIYNGINSKLIYFDEQTVSEQITKTINELKYNLDVYLQQSNDANIQNVKISNKDVFYNCLHIAKEKMIEYEEMHYSKFRV